MEISGLIHILGVSLGQRFKPWN